MCWLGLGFILNNKLTNSRTELTLDKYEHLVYITVFNVCNVSTANLSSIYSHQVQLIKASQHVFEVRAHFTPAPLCMFRLAGRHAVMTRSTSGSVNS